MNSESSRENQNSPRGEEQPDYQTGHTPPQVLTAPAKLEMPPANPQCDESCSEEKHWLDYVTFGLEFIGLVVLCIYAAYTIKIYSANKQAADAAASAANTAAQSMHIDQQAWIGVIVGRGPLVNQKPDHDAH